MMLALLGDEPESFVALGELKSFRCFHQWDFLEPLESGFCRGLRHLLSGLGLGQLFFEHCDFRRGALPRFHRQLEACDLGVDPSEVGRGIACRCSPPTDGEAD